MWFRRSERLALWVAALALCLSAASRAESATPTQSAPQDFSTAAYVYIALDSVNQEQGIRLVEGLDDGRTEPAPRGGRRTAAAPAGTERYIYFDVDDSYIYGGLNQVIVDVHYEDVGLTPIYLEYDAYDVVNPANLADAWVKKRVTVAARTNSGGLKTARVVLDDARFANNQPGGADFRLVTRDELVVRLVSVMRSSGPTNLPVRVVVDGNEVIFDDVPPFVHPETHTTLVPMRKLFNALGIPNEQIAWDEATRTVTVQKGKTTIILRVDSGQALVDGQPVELKQPAIIKDGRTLIPLRFVSENLGLKVHWDDRTRLITISSQSAEP